MPSPTDVPINNCAIDDGRYAEDEDIPPKPVYPFTPILPPIDDNLDTEYTDGILVPCTGASPGVLAERTIADAVVAVAAPLEVSETRHRRMKFKSCGIRANKTFFIMPEHLSKYEFVSESIMIDGEILRIPQKGSTNEYIFRWTTTVNLPVGIDHDHLVTRVFKGHKVGMMKLKNARTAFDAEYPNGKGTKQKQKRKRRVREHQNEVSRTPNTQLRSPTIPLTSVQATNVSTTELRMSPGTRIDTTIVPPVDNTQQYTEHSSSDDGSEFAVGDTYYPILTNNNEDIEDSEDYDPEFMEMDGNYSTLLKNVTFQYEALENELQPPSNLYNGSGPCLRRGIGKKFTTVFECTQLCGGLSITFFKRLAANSNQYARLHMTPDGKFAGRTWRNISLEEMVRFHGVILKMSIDNRSLGGYESYFETNLQVNLGLDYMVTLKDYPPWAALVFSVNRFKQIRAAYHPEVGASSVRDKCHQLRFAINSLNAASKATFIPGLNLSFDEGGVASRSRMNPVRQYNKDKPKKFRVDFFVLANNAPNNYFIVHIDVYQGKNSENIGIPEEIKSLPTTQKAVANAVMQSGIGNDPDGMRRLFMDNRYTAAPLFILLRERFDILCAGTTRKNRIGWPKDQMNMPKSAPRGSNMVLYDKTNKVLVLQWKDNKVVSCTSTLGVSGLVPVKRRVGPNVVEFQVEKALRAYQEYMDAVDRGDQIREVGSGFASKAHYKKWYKKAFFAVIDFMLLNSLFAWNMSANDDTLKRLVVTKSAFYAALAEEMIMFVDEEHITGNDQLENPLRAEGHVPLGINKGSRSYCAVCKLEEKWRKEDGKKDMYGKNSRCQQYLALCSKACCLIPAHTIAVEHERKLFKMEGLEGLSCFEIAHSPVCKGLWRTSTKAGKTTTRQHKKVRAVTYSVRRSHPVYCSLLQLYGRRQEKRPGRKKEGDNDDNEFLDENASDGDGSLSHNSFGPGDSNDAFEDEE